MGKFQDLTKNVLNVFATKQWQDTNLKVFPENFVATKNTGEFLRVSIIPTGGGLNIKSASGVLIFDVFVMSGLGPQRPLFIADKLDEFFCGKSFGTSQGKLQFSKNSTLSKGYPDSDNPSLFRVQYTIPFSYFGVL